MPGIMAVAEQIDRLEREKKELESRAVALYAALAGLVEDLDELITHSDGVYGLHLNDDPAPWSDLLAGGRYEKWLEQLEIAKKVLLECGRRGAGDY